MLRNPTLRKNYHGFSPEWVPRASYTFYKRTVDEALENLEAFENAYIAYHAALDDMQHINEKLSKVYSNTSRMVATLDADIKDLDLSAQDLNRQITSKTPVVEKARKELLRVYNKEIQAIKSAFGLSVPQMQVSVFSFLPFLYVHF